MEPKFVQFSMHFSEGDEYLLGLDSDGRMWLGEFEYLENRIIWYKMAEEINEDSVEANS